MFSSFLFAGQDLHAERALHHVDELDVVDLAVAVRVDAGEQLLDLLLVQREVVAGQALTQLFGADRAAVVLIKVGKG